MRFAAGILFAAVLLAGPVFAQWRVAQENPAGIGNRINIAIVENDSGSSLRLFNDETQTVRGIFTIRDGFDTIDPRVCPTYRVDNREPQRVTFEEGRCRVLPRRAEFTLGKAGQGRNRQLHRIMNGDSIAIRYRLAGGNYRETTFTLRGSKYALTTAVNNLEVGIDE
ncbi:MAG: hypothetical protein BMS9Abin01_0144 [Gammaproteobacteria bacterium]|nr:MAG: hypothetical protein BMS9Abin01_0144 [Gammaproteobacteria bacterium]